VADVAARLGVSTYSLYDWMRNYGPRSDERQPERDQQAEIRRLKADPKRVTEERDILKSRSVLRQAPRVRYAFISWHQQLHPVRRLCRLLEVHSSSYYARSREPLSARARDNRRLTGLIKQFWLESGGVYGYRKIHVDLRSIGECCGLNRVHRLMRTAGLRAEIGYRRHPRAMGGAPDVVAPNRLQ